MACVAVSSLARTIELEFLQPHPRPILQQTQLIPCNKDLIQSLHQKLGSLIELFDENRMDGIQAIRDLETKLRDVAFRVEDEIESQIADLYEEEEEEEEEFGLAASRDTLKLGHTLQRAIEDIDTISEELVKVKECEHVLALRGRKITLDVFPKSDEATMTSDSSRHADEDKMVGKDKEFETIMEMLIQRSSKQREIICIKGMGGIGKTTLARKVYEDPSIASYFDKKAWVVASQQHSKRRMLEGLLKSMGYANSDTDDGELYSTKP